MLPNTEDTVVHEQPPGAKLQLRFITSTSPTHTPRIHLHAELSDRMQHGKSILTDAMNGNSARQSCTSTTPVRKAPYCTAHHPH